MPAPSQLSIATSVVQRLVKEESSYHAELSKQEARLQKLQDSPAADDENAEFQLKQEKAAIEETKAVFPRLKERIQAALMKLEDQLEIAQESGAGSEEEVGKAKDTIQGAKKSLEA